MSMAAGSCESEGRRLQSAWAASFELRFPASLGAADAIEKAEAAQNLLENTPPGEITELLTEGKRRKKRGLSRRSRPYKDVDVAIE